MEIIGKNNIPIYIRIISVDQKTKIHPRRCKKFLFKLDGYFVKLFLFDRPSFLYIYIYIYNQSTFYQIIILKHIHLSRMFTTYIPRHSILIGLQYCMFSAEFNYILGIVRYG